VQSLGDAGDLRGGLGRASRVVARDQNMNVAADFLRSGDGIERRGL